MLTKIPTNKTLLISIFTVSVISTLVVGYGVLDSYPRYESWKALSMQKLKSSALDYYKGESVCLYVVDCSSGVARLKLIQNFASIDFDKLKETIWKRRFSAYCEGYTENIVIDTPALEDSYNDARWSFFNDRFITNHGHFQGSAASFYPYQKCLQDRVTWPSSK